MRDRIVAAWVGVTVGGALASCSPGPEPVAIPLMDWFDRATVDGTVPAAEVERVEWRFDGEGTVELPETTGNDGNDADDDAADLGATFGWEALHDVDDLSVRDGRLVGTVGELAILRAARPASLEASDFLHAVEITMRVDAGDQVRVAFSRSAAPDAAAARRAFEGAFASPLRAALEPGDDLHTYTLEDPARCFPISAIQHVLIQPSDEPGAVLEIESVRLVSRVEHLRAIDAGPGWQGLGEIYRETVVSRSPERITFDLELPSNPWLELAVGTIEPAPVTFVVDIGDTTVWRRTVTTPRRWEPVRVDLSAYAGAPAGLSLSLESGEDGVVGFWGTPVVRNGRGRASGQDEVTVARGLLPDDGERRPQGVIVFLADTLRSDHLDAYGYERETAPFLSRLAAEGVRFDDTISQATWTKVSVPTLLSAIYPPSHGIVNPSDRLSSSATTMAEAFRAAGYATYQTSSVLFSGRSTNLHQGVEVLHESASIDRARLGHSSSKTARTYVDRFLAWLNDHHDVPFYAFIHVFDPHYDYEPYPPYDLRWASPGGKGEHEARLQVVRDHFGDDLRPDDADRRGARSFPTASELEDAGADAQAYNAHLLDWYDGSIRGMDAELARLFEGLRERGVADDTLLAFVSDHGEEFFDHGWGWHGNTVYGEVVNVPLVFWWPGVLPAGVVVDDTVESISLMPTVLELAALPLPETAQGQSLLPLVVEPEDPTSVGWDARPAFSQRRRVDSPRERAPYDPDQYAVVMDGWKLVQNVDPSDTTPAYELYDHAADPLDLVDVADQHPEIVERLSGELARRLRFLEARALPSEAAAVEDLSPEELQRLRSLGYVR